MCINPKVVIEGLGNEQEKAQMRSGIPMPPPTSTGTVNRDDPDLYQLALALVPLPKAKAEKETKEEYFDTVSWTELAGKRTTHVKRLMLETFTAMALLVMGLCFVGFEICTRWLLTMGSAARDMTGNPALLDAINPACSRAFQSLQFYAAMLFDNHACAALLWKMSGASSLAAMIETNEREAHISRKRACCSGDMDVCSKLASLPAVSVAYWIHL